MAPPRKTLLESMSDKTLIGDDCWEWNGAHDPDGYCYVKFGGVQHRAHRAIYELLVGPIPVGKHLHHLCENKGCVRPAHLEPIGAGDHERHHAALITHCPHGHEYTPENTYIWNNARDCRACSRLKNERRRRRG